MTAPAQSAKPDLLNLECITGDMGTVAVFVEALEQFISNLREEVRNDTGKDAIYREINAVDTMAFEIKHRVAEMKAGIDEFIDAAPAAHLWAERKPS